MKIITKFYAKIMNSRNELFEDSQKCIVERRNLKVKLRKFTNECIQKNCEGYLTKIKKLNLNDINNEKSINNAIKLGMNFHFNKNQYNSINRNMKRINEFMIDENNKIDNDYKHFCKTLKNEFSINELEAIKSDQLYYIPDINIRNNLKINKNQIIDMNNSNNSSLLNVNKRIYNKFCNRKFNLNNKRMIKNIRIINNIIKTGIKNLKLEEKEKIIQKEKITKLLNDFREKSKKEVFSLIKDTNYKKLFNGINEKTFFKDNNDKINDSFQIKKKKSLKFNKNQSSLDLNHSQSNIIFPNILLKRKIYPYNNKLLSESKNNEDYGEPSLKLSKNLLYNNYLNSINNYNEDFRQKRVQNNIKNRKKEEEMYKKYNKKIKDNCSRNNFSISNIKRSILNKNKIKN